MKKLSLGKLNLRSEEVIERSQLAGIYGGSEGSGIGKPCVVTCESGYQYNVPTCSVGCPTFDPMVTCVGVDPICHM